MLNTEPFITRLVLWERNKRSATSNVCPVCQAKLCELACTMFVSTLAFLVVVCVDFVSGEYGCVSNYPIIRNTIRLPRGSEILSVREFDQKVCAFHFILSQKTCIYLHVADISTHANTKPSCRLMKDFMTCLS